MSGYNFTDRVRHVLQGARTEAAHLRHEYVGPEHLALALIHVPGGAAANVIAALDADIAAIERTISATVKPGRNSAAAVLELPYRGRAKKVLEYAMMAAKELHHPHVGTEHLLLGVLREKRGVGAQALANAGVTIHRVIDALRAGVHDDVGAITVVDTAEPTRTTTNWIQRLSRIFSAALLVLSLPLYRAIALILVGLLAPTMLFAQAAPRLDPLPVAASLAELDFTVANVPPMAIHPSGCVALFDTDASQVICIDPVSAAVHRFGRSGKGPGEFRSVNAMVGMPDGALLVFDVLGNLRFTLIDRDWKLDRVVRVSQQLHGLFRPTRDSVLTVGGPRDRDLIAISLRDGGIATHFAPAATDTSLFVGPNPYDFFGFWPVPLRRGGWDVVSAWHYSILAEDEHGQVRTRFGRSVEREQSSDQELASMKALLVKANPGLNLDGIIERLRKSPKPVIQRAPVEDGKDRLWVPTGRVRQDSTELDVFDAGGRFAGTRRVPGEVEAMAVHDLDLYVLVEYLAGEHAGSQGVLRYRIR